MSDPRDERLGDALRELHVPEHAPGFHAALRARLEQDARNRSALGVRRRYRRPSWTWALAAVAATVVALVVQMGIFEGGPRRATAAEVRQKVANAWASASSVSGELVVEDARAYGPGKRRWEFVLTARGDVQLKDLTRGGDVAYDASQNVERRMLPSESMPGTDALFASESTGLAPGLPDQGPSYDILDRSLGSVVRALVAGRGGSVREVTHEGRPAWLLGTGVRENVLAGTASPNHVEVIVDQQTGFPIQVVATNGDRTIFETRIEGLRVDPTLPDGAFALDFPVGVEVFRTDGGFRRMPLDDVASATGHEPLVPSKVPEGYELSEVAVSTKPSPTGTEGGNPAVGNVVSLSYRRGLDQFIVTTRPVGDDRSAWGDPLASGEGYVDAPESVTFSTGSLRGSTGQLLIDPLAVPHVWSITDDLVVTVSGDLTRAELLDVAGSLR